jgi:hypothetical protein
VAQSFLHPWIPLVFHGSRSSKCSSFGTDPGLQEVSNNNLFAMIERRNASGGQGGKIILKPMERLLCKARTARVPNGSGRIGSRIEADRLSSLYIGSYPTGLKTGGNRG